VLRTLLDQTSQLPAWVSFSCRNSEQVNDGTALEECVALFDDCPAVVAVGVNCTDPRYLPGLIARARAGAPSKRIVVYPNSGEVYEIEHRSWSGRSRAADFGRQAREWYDAGASLIGGCCRTGPAHIRAIREALG
jgi:homocysteine S-methyltransferase